MTTYRYCALDVDRTNMTVCHVRALLPRVRSGMFLEAALEALGSEGWALVAVDTITDLRSLYIFQQPREARHD